MNEGADRLYSVKLYAAFAIAVSLGSYLLPNQATAEASNIAAPIATDKTTETCFGATIHIQAHAKEESITSAMAEIRQNFRMANLRPARRLPTPDIRLIESKAEFSVEYSKPTDFRCAQALLSIFSRKSGTSSMNTTLTDGLFVIIWNEKSPVIYGAQLQK